MKRLSYNKIITSNSSTRAFIFFHGWKGNKNSFKNLPSILNLENIDWYFPEGPFNVGDSSNEQSWAYESSQGVYEIDKTKKLLRLFIEENISKNYKLENVYLMGFSQGAAVCYELFLNPKYIWGAIFPVAGFLYNKAFRESNRHITLNSIQQSIPIVIGHGIKDNIIPIKISERVFQLLTKNNANVDFIKYNGAHKISIDYLKQVKTVIENKR